MTILKVRVTFIEEVLGTASSTPAVHEEFIASRAPDAQTREEEIAAIGVEEAVERSMTVFPREGEAPFVWDYQLKGFFKDACGMLSRVPDTKSKKIKAYKKVIDGIIFITPRKIPLNLNGGSVGSCQRPLRAQTAQGERIALANSETVPIGTSIEFEIHSLNDSYVDTIKEWLDYGNLRGFGQWRNSGKGRFTYEILE